MCFCHRFFNQETEGRWWRWSSAAPFSHRGAPQMQTIPCVRLHLLRAELRLLLRPKFSPLLLTPRTWRWRSTQGCDSGESHTTKFKSRAKSRRWNPRRVWIRLSSSSENHVCPPARWTGRWPTAAWSACRRCRSAWRGRSWRTATGWRLRCWSTRRRSRAATAYVDWMGFI